METRIFYFYYVVLQLRLETDRINSSMVHLNM
uniref:Uncharacterized protein n=1 Tax=Arundo donax TaxID=35708 RepID=A0A0A8YKP8_ARUDO